MAVEEAPRPAAMGANLRWQSGDGRAVDAQRRALEDTIKKSVGADIALDVTVDESLIGGLVVKVGSKMIDTSIRSKLANLQTAMKEAG